MACNLVVLLALLLGVRALQAASPVYVLNRQAASGRNVPATDDFAAVVEYYSGGAPAATSPELSVIFQLYPFELLAEPAEVVLVEDLDQFEGLGSPSFYAFNVTQTLTRKRAAPAVYRADSPDFARFLAAAALQPRSNILVVGVSRGAAAHKPHAREPPAKRSVPAFYLSAEDCEAQTRWCSGHGACVKQGNGLFACQCRPSEASGRTVAYGGNDCSKRDVSWQFNLLVFTTLAIFVAGALSVSLLYKLGSEPLPGILTTI